MIDKEFIDFCENSGIPVQKIVAFLFQESKAPQGYFGQIIGDNSCAATTGTLVYVGNKLGLYDDSDRDRLYNEILQLRTSEGSYKSSKRESLWATSLVTRACIEISEGIDKYTNESLNWIIKKQRKNGGWSYTGNEAEQTRLIYGFYSARALIEADRVKGGNKLIQKRLARFYKQALKPRTKLSEVLLQKSILSWSYWHETGMVDENALAEHQIRVNMLDLDTEEFTYTETGHPLFYIKFFMPGIYLLLRNTIEAEDFEAHLNMFWLQHNVLKGKGWSFGKEEYSEPYIWSTAIGLYSLYCWWADLKALSSKPSIVGKKQLILMKTKVIHDEKRQGGKMVRCFKAGTDNCQYGVINEDDKQLFVAMPFSDDLAETIFEHGIKKVASDKGLQVWRADQKITNIDVMCKICKAIQESRFAVVNLSSWNANVLFELGLLYGLGKIVILIKDKQTKIPTNLKGLEYISYGSPEVIHKDILKFFTDNNY